MGGHPGTSSYPLACLPEVQTRAGWSTRGKCFTETLDFVLKDIAKKHQGILRDMVRAPVAAVAVADPTPACNDRKFSPSVRNKHVPYLLIQLLHVSPIRGLSISG